MATALSDVSGIGPATIPVLKKQGFKSVSDLAAADIETLVAIQGFSTLRATKVIESARSLVSADEVVVSGKTSSTKEKLTKTKKEKKVKNKKKDNKESKSKKDSKAKKSDKVKKSKKDKKVKKPDKDKKAKKAKK